ncbi:MAG TPA: hypothetical protein VE007_06845 [Thermoanaerobaculia bacterium]|nr:hypothetical protein [Thermoanaerobaculia bacterium]
MARSSLRIGAALAAGMFVAALAFAAKPDAYQVTGNVVEVSGDKIVVMKGKERFEVARDAGTKMSGDVKVGDKVTIHYRMTATEVESKAGAAKAPAKSTAKTKKAA